LYDSIKRLDPALIPHQDEKQGVTTRNANGVSCVRGVEVESPMRPAAVVVACVDPQDSLETPMAAKEGPHPH
jgi:hypothetical protein